MTCNSGTGKYFLEHSLHDLSAGKNSSNSLVLRTIVCCLPAKLHINQLLCQEPSAMTNTPIAHLPSHLTNLSRACELWCVAACCGVGAFDFSPIAIAHWLAQNYSRELDQEIGLLLKEVDDLERLAASHFRDDNEPLLTIDEFCDSFTSEEFAMLVAELRHSVKASKQILDLDKSLELPRNLRIAMWRVDSMSAAHRPREVSQQNTPDRPRLP